MSIELAEKIAWQLKEIQPLLVSLHLSGESLLHKKLVEIVAITKKSGSVISLSSNGIMMTGEKAEALIGAGLDDLRIDFAADRAVYEEIRQKAIWETVRTNIRGLLELKRALGTHRPNITLVNLDLGDNPKQAKERLAKMRAIFPLGGFNAVNLDLHTWAGEFAESDKVSSVINYQREKRKCVPCPHLYTSFNITWNGKVVPCCRDLQQDVILGDINEKSILEIWNAPEYVAFREKHARGKFHEIPLCRGCDQVWREHSLMKMMGKTLYRHFVLRFLRLFPKPR